jgi:cobalt-zinc-cadmium resistance protein CzcA
MVIVVAALGMVPAMLAQGIGSDIQRPLATVLVGGLTSTLLLTPLALPAVYLVAERVRRSRAGGSRDTAGSDGGPSGQAGHS